MNVVAPSPTALKALPWDDPSDAAEEPFPARGLVEEVITRTGVPASVLAAALEDCLRNGSDLGDELVSHGVREDVLAKAIASALGVTFAVPRADERQIWRPPGRDPRLLRTYSPALHTRVYIAPRLATLRRTAEWIAENGGDAVIVTTRSALRAHMAEASAPSRLHAARFRLFTERPEWSARNVLTAPQGYALGIATSILLLAAAFLGWLVVTALHAAISLLFLSITGLRLFILLDHRRERRRRALERNRAEDELRLPASPLPIYTILVALRHEDRMVPALVEALGRLNWPRSRLDIKLVCEADDPATLEAVRAAIEGRAGFELCVVQPALPRTKPKALNHALPVARGDFVVLYDAEDRPDPDQLLEAWLAFERAGPRLACVQAPLVIRNGSENGLTAMFALEYAVLFRAQLPFLARRNLPIPLGGTSNHFRRSALDRVGAWDSHNVAEDADLGIRLARHGYVTDVISAPTSEIAPTRWRDWRNQRARWVKGWIQTYCVHMRHPVLAARQLGAMRMFAFQMLFLAMVAGAVMHTAFVAFVALVILDVALTGETTFDLGWLMVVDVLNIVSAALVFTLLASEVATRRERPLVRYCSTLWLYWIFVSLASLRSLRKLFTDPHGWEKTPHHEPAALQEGR